LVESVWFWSASTLVVGLIVGYLAQKSGFCTIGGYRDFILFRDTHLLKGVIGFIIGGIVGYSLLTLAGAIYFANQFPWSYFNGVKLIAGSLVKTNDLATAWITAIIGGIGLGFFSVLSGGCPLRNAVMASEGNKSSIWYLMGFTLMAPIVVYVFNLIGTLP
jgi:uncharacterized membrane protein YedE/YeeE